MMNELEETLWTQLEQNCRILRWPRPNLTGIGPEEMLNIRGKYQRARAGSSIISVLQDAVQYSASMLDARVGSDPEVAKRMLSSIRSTEGKGGPNDHVLLAKALESAFARIEQLELRLDPGRI